MRVVVTYEDGGREVYTSPNESGTTSDALSFADGRNSPPVANLVRMSGDVAKQGLRFELFWYSADIDEETAGEEADLGEGPMWVPVLNLERGRIWRILDPEHLVAVREIVVDGTWRWRRMGGELVDMSAFDEAQAHWLGAAERDKAEVDQVVGLHERIRRAHPELGDAEVAAMYGFSLEAWLGVLREQARGSDGPPGTDIAATIAAILSVEPETTPADLVADYGLAADDVRAAWGEAVRRAGTGACGEGDGR